MLSDGVLDGPLLASARLQNQQLPKVHVGWNHLQASARRSILHGLVLKGGGRDWVHGQKFSGHFASIIFIIPIKSGDETSGWGILNALPNKELVVILNLCIHLFFFLTPIELISHWFLMQHRGNTVFVLFYYYYYINYYITILYYTILSSSRCWPSACRPT